MAIWGVEKIIVLKSEEIVQVQGAHTFPHRKAYLSGEKKLSESGTWDKQMARYYISNIWAPFIFPFSARDEPNDLFPYGGYDLGS